MSDFQKFINRKEHDPYKNIRISRVENDRKRQEEISSEPQEPEPKPLLFASLIANFKKIFLLFFNKEHSHQLLLNPQQILDHVATLQVLLQMLIDEDLSHNTAFTHQLSQVWHNLVDDCNSLLSISEQVPSYVIKIQSFINVLSQYPPNEDHSLGFYLTASAGEDWIPFPFMDMLKQLHQECQKFPEQATLIQWLIELTDILNS